MKVGDIVLVKPGYKSDPFYVKIVRICSMDIDDRSAYAYPYCCNALLAADYTEELVHPIDEELCFAEDEMFPITDIEYNKIQKILIFK